MHMHTQSMRCMYLPGYASKEARNALFIYICIIYIHTRTYIYTYIDTYIYNVHIYVLTCIYTHTMHTHTQSMRCMYLPGYASRKPEMRYTKKKKCKKP
jgi:hypothetical protein